LVQLFSKSCKERRLFCKRRGARRRFERAAQAAPKKLLKLIQEVVLKQSLRFEKQIQALFFLIKLE